MTSQTTARRIRQRMQSTGRTDADLSEATGIPLPTLTAELDGVVPFDWADFATVALELGDTRFELGRAA
ncbi:hypothetical protein [Curtobacterium sp. MCSS17_006]|uniref:hypothetical protein n=1 Tax=Curtobacterium sp. MCSS17_006 TaxID=2175642 RepID=UPI0011B4CE39|nr:hypothetical protein [Curtobacterium sp. MCSS17_006]